MIICFFCFLVVVVVVVVEVVWAKRAASAVIGLPLRLLRLRCYWNRCCYCYYCCSSTSVRCVLAMRRKLFEGWEDLGRRRRWAVSFKAGSDGGESEGKV